MIDSHQTQEADTYRDEIDLRELFRVGQEQVEIAEAGAVCRLERACRLGPSRHEAGHHGHGQRHGAAGPEQVKRQVAYWKKRLAQ